MNGVQMGAAACEPLRPSGWSSRPTQTTVNGSGVKPTNRRASRWSCPSCQRRRARNRRRAGGPVPSFSTLRIMLTTGKSCRGADLLLRPIQLQSSCRPRRRVRARGAADLPPLETAVRRGDLDRRRLEHAQRDRRIRVRVGADADALPEARHLVEARHLGDLDRRDVARERQRAPERDQPVVLVLVVTRRPLRVRIRPNLERRRLVVHERGRREIGAALAAAR